MANTHLLRPSSPFFVYSTIFAGLLLNIFPWGNHFWVPDWLLLVVVFWTINEPRKVSIWLAFILGILMDVHSSSTLGVHAFAYSLVFYITVAWHRRILDLTTPTQMFHLLPILIIPNSLDFLMAWLLKGVSPWAAIWILAPGVINALLWPFAKWTLSTPHRRQNQSLPL